MRGLVVFDQCVFDLAGSQQIVGIEQAPGDFRVLLHGSADRSRDALPRFAAQPWMSIEVHMDAAHAAHLTMGRLDMQANAQLLEHTLLHALQLFQALQVFQAFEQALFLVTRQQQHARIGARQVQQLIALTVTGSRRAGISEGKR